VIKEGFHPSDQDLLLCADGELPRRQAKKVREHLTACWKCRARMAEIERTIGNFVKVHHRSLDPWLPPLDGPRTFLKMRLAAITWQPRRVHRWSPNFLLHPTGLASICAFTLVLVLAASVVYRRAPGAWPSSNRSAQSLPNRNLTPGATRPVQISEICAMDHDQVVLPVSDALQRQVFQEYGLRNASADNYEVDYLISPGLAGTGDLRNLWPEPRYNTTWNSFVKDQLEDYLHQSVCSGKVDLVTAQKDVSTNWISAYKKYFRTKEPAQLSTRNIVPVVLDPSESLSSRIPHILSY
jgi:hypothetical protein